MARAFQFKSRQLSGEQVVDIKPKTKSDFAEELNFSASDPLAPEPIDLSNALRKTKPFLVRAAWQTVIASVLSLSSILYMLQVYDRAVGSRNITTLLMLTVILLVVYVVYEAQKWGAASVLHEAGQLFDELLHKRVFFTSYEANLKHLPGGTPQLMLDLRTLREFFNSGFLVSIFQLPMIMIFTWLLYWSHPVLAALALCLVLIQSALAYLTERSVKPNLIAARNASAEAQRYAENSLKNSSVVEALGILPNIHKRWYAHQKQFLVSQANASLDAARHQATTGFVVTAGRVLIMGAAAWLHMHDNLAGGGGMILGSSIVFTLVVGPLVGLVSDWRSSVVAREAWRRLRVMMDALPPKPESMALPAPMGELTAENLVALVPNTQTPILRGINFQLRPGEVLAVVGPSAAGKSTLAKVLMGVWPSLGGKARLDGVDLYAWNKSEVGPSLGYLPQDTELLEGTVAENIARFGPIDHAKLNEVCDVLGLTEFIANLPKGADTDVGPEGTKLSGGERQRIGLARAFYGSPKMVVLDEPDAHLDEVNENLLRKAIQHFKQQRTTIVLMSHKKSMMGVVDKLLVLRDGTVYAYGGRDQVMNSLLAAAVPPPAVGVAPDAAGQGAMA